ncbi:MAG: hypothetical protein PGN14_16595, partial [Sphingomonas adhaesiva]
MLLASVVIPSFSHLERRSAAVHVERTQALLRALCVQVEEAARDHADLAPPDHGQVRGAEAILHVARDGRVTTVHTSGHAASLLKAGTARWRPQAIAAMGARGFFLRQDGRVVAIGVAPDRHGGAVVAMRSGDVGGAVAGVGDAGDDRSGA